MDCGHQHQQPRHGKNCKQGRKNNKRFTGHPGSCKRYTYRTNRYPKTNKSVSYSQSQNDINANTKDSYILIFKSFKEATEYLQENQNEPQDDISHLNEAETYYEKIVNYLNK